MIGVFGLDVPLLATGGLGQSVLPSTASGGGEVGLYASGVQSYSYARAKDTILWTYGARHLLDKAAGMNFTIVITPGQIFDIPGDTAFLKSAQAEGVGVAFDMRAACENWTDPRWQYHFQTWLLAIKDLPALRYIMPYPDVDGQIKYIVQAGDYSPIANLQSLSIAALITKIAPNVKTLGTFTRTFYKSPSGSKLAKYLARMNLEGISVYSQWGGNDGNSKRVLSSYQEDITTFAGLYTSLADKSTTSLCLWLQGFESTRLASTSPVYSDWVALWDSAVAASDRFNVVGFFAWQPPGENVAGIGNSQLLQNDVAWFNANVMLKPYVMPRSAIVSAGSAISLSCTVSNAVWHLKSAPAGTTLSSYGVLTAGSAGGICNVWIYAPGTVVTNPPQEPLAKATIYVDKEP